MFPLSKLKKLPQTHRFDQTFIIVFLEVFLPPHLQCFWEADCTRQEISEQNCPSC